MKELKSFDKPVLITKPLLPDLNEVRLLLENVWSSNQLTNNGSMAQLLEQEVSRYLNASHLSLFSNGTIALQVACKVLRLSGEVITTPFTFAATPHSLAWCGIKPVFCDIDDDTLTIDASKIENHITDRTTGILPVHVYGTPCNVQEIQRIAEKYHLQVLYDAAHAFGVEVGGKPIGSFGDASMFSLHATKIYHTIEGGALTFANKHMKERADRLRNFGLLSEESVMEPGTNGKLNEVQAAVGLLVLKMVDSEIENRRLRVERYVNNLKETDGIRFIGKVEGVRQNYPYFVIRISSQRFGRSRNEVYEELKKFNVFARRYFYPLCSNFKCYKDLPSAQPENLPVATAAAEEVLSLPLHGRMDMADIDHICDILTSLKK